MPYIRKTCGDSNIDKVFDDIYRILNNLISIQSTAIVDNNFELTPEGGFAVKVTNGTGYQLNKGVLVRVSSTSNRTAIIAPVGAYDIAGIMYDVTPNNSIGLMVVSGIADVLFNSNGANRQDYFRMSKSTDSGSPSDGEAHSETINRIDTIRMMGFVLDTIVGSGLSRCVIKR